jgi:hypothetical protein
MKTSFDKFMASNAVTEVTNVELSEVKVELAMDVNTIMKEADSLIFENAKLEGKAISLLNQAHKIYTSSWPDPKPLLAEFENALKQMATLGIEPPKTFAINYATYKKEIANLAKMKTAVLGKLADIDSIQGSFDR